MAADKNKVMRKIQELSRKGRWDKALDEIKALRAREPQDPMVTLRMGDIYLKTGDRQSAAKSYSETAELFESAGHTAKAIAACKMILRIDPANSEAERRLDELASTKPATARTAPASFGAVKQTQDAPEAIELSEPTESEAVIVQGSHEEVMGHAAVDAPGGYGDIDPSSMDEGIVGGSGLDSGEAAAGDDISHLIEREPGASDTVEPGASDEPVPGQPIPLFSDIPADELWELVGRMKKKTFAEGETIVSEGEQGDSLYIIKSGGAMVMTRVKGMNVLLAELGERDFFGEVSFLTGRPRTADIVASKPTEILELSRDELEKVIERYHGVEDVLRAFHENRISDTLSSIKAVPKELFQ